MQGCPFALCFSFDQPKITKIPVEEMQSIEVDRLDVLDTVLLSGGIAVAAFLVIGLIAFNNGLKHIGEGFHLKLQKWIKSLIPAKYHPGFYERDSEISGLIS